MYNKNTQIRPEHLNLKKDAKEDTKNTEILKFMYISKFKCFKGKKFKCFSRIGCRICVFLLIFYVFCQKIYMQLKFNF